MINDSSASEIAVSFYKNLLGGLTIGESLRKAKIDFFDNNPEDLSWSAFTLYGDPNLKKDFEEEAVKNRLCVLAALAHNTSSTATTYELPKHESGTLLLKSLSLFRESFCLPLLNTSVIS
jgi:hypothetical protein